MSHAHTHTNMKILAQPARTQNSSWSWRVSNFNCLHHYIEVSKSARRLPPAPLGGCSPFTPGRTSAELRPWTALSGLQHDFFMFPDISCIAASEHVRALWMFVRLFSSKEFSHIDFSKLYDVPPGQGLHTLASVHSCHVESWRLGLLLPRICSARSHTGAMAALFLCPC